MAYVSEYGNYGGEGVIVFDDNLLTPEEWEELEILSDSDKLNFVAECISNKGESYLEFNF